LEVKKGSDLIVLTLIGLGSDFLIGSDRWDLIQKKAAFQLPF
jgi:hypothetical protein